MSYLLDRKIKRKKSVNIAIVVIIFLILIYFRAGVFRGFSSAAHFVFRPVIKFGGGVREEISSIGLNFRSKKTLSAENENLKSQIAESAADRANYASLVDENNKLKEILNRKTDKKEFILAGILAKPNQSPYDTLIIDAGKNDGVTENAKVFALGHSLTGEALGNVPIGRVVEVFTNSSKVILFSNPREKTDVVILGRDIFLQAIGRGGGNFELVLPRDLEILKDAEADLPGIEHYILGTVQSIISDPRDSFQKALLTSPVNVQELKFVEIEK